jgi:hypothetical protein
VGQAIILSKLTSEAISLTETVIFLEYENDEIIDRWIFAGYDDETTDSITIQYCI